MVKGPRFGSAGLFFTQITQITQRCAEGAEVRRGSFVHKVLRRSIQNPNSNFMTEVVVRETPLRTSAPSAQLRAK